MSKAIFTIALLFTFSLSFSQKIGETSEKVNPGDFKYSEVFGSTGEMAFAGDISDGALNFGVFTAGNSHFESAKKLTMMNGKNRRVDIKNAFASQQGLIVIGELKTKYGIEQYVGRVDDAESNLVEGLYFNTVNSTSKTPVYQMSYHYSKVTERIGVTYLTENLKTKETIINVVLVNLSGDVELTGSRSFYRLSEQEMPDVDLEVFLGQYNELAIGYYELEDKEDSKSVQSSISFFKAGTENNFKEVLKSDKEVLKSMKIAQGVENSILVSGFMGEDDQRFANVYSVSFSGENFEKIQESLVPLEVIELFPNEWLYDEKNVDPIVWNDYEVQSTQVSESGIILVYANRNKVVIDKEREVTEIIKDQLFLRLNEGGGLEQSFLIPYRQFIEGAKEDNEQEFEKTLKQEYSEVVFSTRENLTVLYKRPNYDKRVELKEGEKFFPLFLTFNVNDGFFEDMKPPHRNGMSVENSYLNYYLMFDREIER